MTGRLSIAVLALLQPKRVLSRTTVWICLTGYRKDCLGYWGLFDFVTTMLFRDVARNLPCDCDR